MEITYRSIGIYFDVAGNLIGIPMSTAITEKWGEILVSIEPVTELKAGYTDSELEHFILTVLSKSFAYHPIGFPTGESILQKFKGAKSWKACVKEFGYVFITWRKDEGYTITPYWQSRKAKYAFLGFDNKEMRWVTPPGSSFGQLAKGFRAAMKLSPIGPQESPPQ